MTAIDPAEGRHATLTSRTRLIRVRLRVAQAVFWVLVGAAVVVIRAAWEWAAWEPLLALIPVFYAMLAALGACWVASGELDAEIERERNK